ncbi:ATP-binding cassette domain-containing protein [Gluconobacter oxydans]|uniref:ATP-binding cassette domain-containing protein n=2 Tax=Gluconobacter oxydans TaxID=442 RepID=UPI0039ED5565
MIGKNTTTASSPQRLDLQVQSLFFCRNPSVADNHLTPSNVSNKRSSKLNCWLKIPMVFFTSGEGVRLTKTVITGPSGSGKSTLLRAMAGLSSEGEGKLSLPRERRIMFLPQRPYLPHGTLLDLMLPDRPHSPENRALCAMLLRRFLLPGLVDQLDVGGDWSQRLSPGEQQRFALARAFVSSPDVLVLDEATSGLDQETAAAIYRILLDHPALTLISVVHARDLMMLHSKRLHIAGGVGRVMDNQEPPSGALLSLHRTS